ncbi:MAG: membrane protein insertion efficiency factor YidD, partial [Bacilli bacterium]
MKKFMIRCIHFYQKHVPHQPHCRYTPTCSQYAVEAYEKHNFFKATFLAIWRILRCNPFSKGG